VRHLLFRRRSDRGQSSAALGFAVKGDHPLTRDSAQPGIGWGENSQR